MSQAHPGSEKPPIQNFQIAQPPTWMPAVTEIIPGCPPGLEYLVNISELLVYQQIELFEVLTNIETKNRYAIMNSQKQQCYFAYEESDLCMRICCKKFRGFTMHIVDNTRREVIRAIRPFKCCAGCCWCADQNCCSYNIDVESPVGNRIGCIRQSQSWIRPYFTILNEQEQPIFNILGPYCICNGPCCLCDHLFSIYTVPNKSNEPVGCITKRYSGFVKECCTDATNFHLLFPIDLDVKMKAVLLSATFLLDVMYFENQNQ